MAIEAEHCYKIGHDFKFVTSNYHIETTPENEYKAVMGLRQLDANETDHNRRIPDLKKLKALPASKHALLTLIEIIMLVLYTGPMVIVVQIVLRTLSYNFHLTPAPPPPPPPVYGLQRDPPSD